MPVPAILIGHHQLFPAVRIKIEKTVILLVDDDRQLRRICRIVLERAGYGIIEADSARAAEPLWNEHAHCIDMLVTDFEMPGLTGLQLSALLRATKPELKVLVISGNCQEAIPSSIQFLLKPFLPSDLVGTVRRCLLMKCPDEMPVSLSVGGGWRVHDGQENCSAKSLFKLV